MTIGINTLCGAAPAGSETDLTAFRYVRRMDGALTVAAKILQFPDV